ncbi:MAG: peptide-methionine (R)-S-oxide reductase MsrB [Myxococcota bacterium]
MSDDDPVTKSEAEWRAQLTPTQFAVVRGKGTERAFTGKFNGKKDTGLYECVACGAALFRSDAKFDSGCGWPSYVRPVDDHAVVEERDTSHGMVRTEIMCGRCGGHLGHVFPDGPAPTGLRYCVNSVSLRFRDDDGDGEVEEG